MNRVAYVALFVVILAIAFGLGYLAHRNEWLPLELRDALRARIAPGQPVSARPFKGDAFPLQDRTRNIDAETASTLNAMGYAAGTQPATSQHGVTIHDSSAASNGLNLYTSGHAPEAVLMDMDGVTLHTWRCPLNVAIPGYTPPAHVRDAARESWRRARLLPDGSLLVVFEGMALVKLGKDSHVLWSYTRGCHHDVELTPEGNVLVLTSEERGDILDNGIALLDPDGVEIKHVSLLDCLNASPYASLAQWLPARGDVLHANTLNWLDGAHANANPAFARGNLLISILELNTIAVVDIERQTLPWALTGITKAQHEPTLLPNGNLIVFDNRGAGEQSRVLEIEPNTQSTVWSHPGDVGAPFYSEWCGSVQRLENGNTLITETDNGRAFEVTPDHRIVWEFVNPNQFDEAGVRMVAALFELVRLDSRPIYNWLAQK